MLHFVNEQIDTLLPFLTVCYPLSMTRHTLCYPFSMSVTLCQWPNRHFVTLSQCLLHFVNDQTDTLLPFLNVSYPLSMTLQTFCYPLSMSVTLAHFKDNNRDRVCLPVFCLSVCVPHKRFLGNRWSHHRQTWRGDYFGYENGSRVTYIDLDLEGHTDRNHENNNGLIISETVQAMPIMFAVKIYRLKVYMIIARPMTLTRLQVRLKLDKFITCNISDNI